MKLLDDLKKRKKVKELLEEIEKEIDDIKSVDDIKKLLKKLVSQMREIV